MFAGGRVGNQSCPLLLQDIEKDSTIILLATLGQGEILDFLLYLTFQMHCDLSWIMYYTKKEKKEK